MMDRFVRWLRQFMQGRYGSDTLNHALMILWMVLAVVNLFVHSILLYVLYTLLCVVCLYRMLSRDIPRRSRENQKFLQFFSGFQRKAQQQRSRAADKSHKYVKCKACGAQLRVRREKGKHTVKCPKCGGKFQIRIF